MRTINYILLFCCCLSTFGQSEMDFLTSVKNTYGSVTSAHSKMQIHRQDETQQLEVWYDQNHSLLINDEFEMLLTPNHYVVVDKKNKAINYQELNSQTKDNDMAKQYQLPIDSLIKLSTSIDIDTISSSSDIQLNLDLKHPLIKKIQILFTSDLSMKKATYSFSDRLGDGSNVVIEYQVFEINPLLDKGRFDLSNYFEDSYQPILAYKDYLVNQFE